MGFVVTQTGSRRGYAVPMILERAGMLECFYTDLAGDVGLGKWLVKCGPLMGLKKAAARLAGRRVPHSIRAKTVTFWKPTMWFACNRALCPSTPNARFREQLRWGRALGRAMSRRGFGNATHLYSMLGEFGPAVTEARRCGLTVVTEVYIALSSENILSRERLRFAEWESPVPDLDAIRNEFPEQKNLLADTNFAVCPSEIVRRDLEEHFAFVSLRMGVASRNGRQGRKG